MTQDFSRNESRFISYLLIRLPLDFMFLIHLDAADVTDLLVIALGVDNSQYGQVSCP